MEHELGWFIFRLKFDFAVRVNGTHFCITCLQFTHDKVNNESLKLNHCHYFFVVVVVVVAKHIIVGLLFRNIHPSLQYFSRSCIHTSLYDFCSSHVHSAL